MGRGHRQLHQPPGRVAGLPVAVHQPRHRADQHGRPLVQPRHRRASGNKDTVSNNPVPDSGSASPYAYAADNPLTGTDPTGHGNIFTEAVGAVESGAEKLQGAAVDGLESVGLTGAPRPMPC